MGFDDDDDVDGGSESEKKFALPPLEPLMHTTCAVLNY
jgi:hypothetical protein